MEWQTHLVFNQPEPLSNSNLYLSDMALREAVMREHAGWDGEDLSRIGLQLGSQESLELGRLANANPPELLRYDAAGQRLDQVRFHPAWYVLMQELVNHRVHNLPWQEDARIGSFVARAARFILHAQVEAGTLCPITMTFGAIPLLQQTLPPLFQSWIPALLSDRYDSHQIVGSQKRGLLIGMGMTEKQGGSDVLSNSTRAEPLTEKLGNRSNASSEVEFDNATAWLLGDEGDGIRQILKMGGYTRFDCALGSHGLMRRAFSIALYHTWQRQAFGKALVDQPLMRQVLSRMALRLEGHTALLMRLANAWEKPGEAHEQVFSRLLTPAAKYRVCGLGSGFVAEAMEVLGGIGYCEQSELPRIYREMPVNSIWEGSGNIMCLDVLRTFRKLPSAIEMLQQEFYSVRGQNRLFDRAWRQLQQRLKNSKEEQGRAITQQLFDLCCASQLLRFASPPLADAWCRMTLDHRDQYMVPEAVCALLLSRGSGMK